MSFIYIECAGKRAISGGMTKEQEIRLKALKLALGLTKVDNPMPAGMYSFPSIPITRQFSPQEMIEAAKLFEAYLNG